MATTYDRLRPRSESALRAELLLNRYPSLSEQELTELVNLFPNLSSVDQVLMTTDGRLSGKFSDFHREHGDKLKMSKVELAVAIAAPALLGIVALYLLLP